MEGLEFSELVHEFPSKCSKTIWENYVFSSADEKVINLTYDGSKFYGYQIQKNKITIEGELEKNLSKILNTNINTIASSRTDKGVHAIMQYCHFDYDKKLDLKRLKHSLNSLINDSIYIKSIKRVSNEFHARYDVVKKEYISL